MLEINNNLYEDSLVKPGLADGEFGIMCEQMGISGQLMDTVLFIRNNTSAIEHPVYHGEISSAPDVQV